jgi:hypothetical protein
MEKEAMRRRRKRPAEPACLAGETEMHGPGEDLGFVAIGVAKGEDEAGTTLVEVPCGLHKTLPADEIQAHKAIYDSRVGRPDDTDQSEGEGID